jgi:hypothetical protein
MHKGSYNRRYIMVAENLSYREAIQGIAENLGVTSPRKQLRQWQLEMLWRLDWLRSRISGSPRKLSKETARGLRGQKKFENNRIKEELGFVFTPVHEVIEECAVAFSGTSSTPRSAASES